MLVIYSENKKTHLVISPISDAQSGRTLSFSSSSYKKHELRYIYMIDFLIMIVINSTIWEKILNNIPYVIQNVFVLTFIFITYVSVVVFWWSGSLKQCFSKYCLGTKYINLLLKNCEDLGLISCIIYQNPPYTH